MKLSDKAGRAAGHLHLGLEREREAAPGENVGETASLRGASVESWAALTCRESHTAAAACPPPPLLQAAPLARCWERMRARRARPLPPAYPALCCPRRRGRRCRWEGGVRELLPTLVSGTSHPSPAPVCRCRPERSWAQAAWWTPLNQRSACTLLRAGPSAMECCTLSGFQQRQHGHMMGAQPVDSAAPLALRCGRRLHRSRAM